MSRGAEVHENAATKLCVAYRGYKDGTVEFFGNQVNELTGFSQDEFNSKKLLWNDLVLEEYKESMKNAFVKALKTTKIYQRTYRIRTKSLSTPWIQEWGQIVCDDSGNIDFVLGIILDVSEEKRIEELQLKCEALTGEYLFFMIDNEEYGIGIDKVAQVIDETPCAGIPGAPHHVKGVINLRGMTIPVVDLRKMLGIASPAHGGSSNIIIVEGKDEADPSRVGLQVDAVSRVVHIDGREVMGAPALLSRLHIDYILGIAMVENRLKVLMDSEKLLATMEEDLPSKGK